MSGKPRLFLDGIRFPEAPRWHGGELWLVDMFAHRVLAVSETGTSRVVAEIDDKPSGIGFLPDGTPIVVAVRTRRLLQLKNGGADLYCDLKPIPGDHLNDLVTDAQGRTYVGNRFPFKGDFRAAYALNGAPVTSNAEARENLVMVRPDRSMQVVAEGFLAPNGIVITPDGKTLIVAETRGNRLVQFSIHDDGTLSNRRLFAELQHNPDGICLDAEGAVWASYPFAGEFQRVLEGGRVTDRIKLPDGKWAVACMLGGSNRKTLYLATAFQTIEDVVRCHDFETDLTSTARGFVEVVDVEVPGAGWP